MAGYIKNSQRKTNDVPMAPKPVRAVQTTPRDQPSGQKMPAAKAMAGPHAAGQMPRTMVAHPSAGQKAKK